MTDAPSTAPDDVERLALKADRERSKDTPSGLSSGYRIVSEQFLYEIALTLRALCKELVEARETVKRYDQADNHSFADYCRAIDRATAAEHRLADALRERDEAWQLIATAYAGLEHGDDQHRAWLKNRFDTHFASALARHARSQEKP